MTAAVEAAADRSDVRTILTGGAVVGVLTTLGVTAFALLSRALTGTAEVIVQAGMILVGGVLFSYLPAARVRPRSVDGIAWAAMVGLLGALVFTVLDTTVLRPVRLYDWTWDAIGGGSGFWYIPVWWMGSAVLAWLGAWVVAMAGRGGREPQPFVLGVQSAGVGVLLFAAATGMRLLPFHAATAALAFSVGLVLHVVIAAVAYRK